MVLQFLKEENKEYIFTDGVNYYKTELFENNKELVYPVFSFDDKYFTSLESSENTAITGIDFNNISLLKKLTAKSQYKEGEYYRILNIKSRFPQYSFYNILLILNQFPNALHLLSEEEFSKMGLSIKKDAKPIMILDPFEITLFEDDNGNIKKVSEATREEIIKIEVGEIIPKKKIYYYQKYVYDVSQTINNVDIKDKKTSLIKLIEEHAINVEIKTMVQNELNGYYDSKNETIYISDNLSDTDCFNLLLTEFLTRLLDEEKTSNEAKEITIKSVIYTVLKHYGFENCFYERFISIDDLKILSLVFKISGYIISKLNETAEAEENESVSKFTEPIETENKKDGKPKKGFVKKEES
jgi:hypothetical protein